MQPNFLRFITMVALLISVICENAKEKKEEIREIQNENLNEENYEELANDQMLDIDATLSDFSSNKADKLAQKFANDAVKSLKMQQTIKKLANIGDSQNDLYKMSQLSAREHVVQKSKMKPNRSKAIKYKDRRQRKRKRHKHKNRRKRFKNRRPRWSKTRPAKVDYDSSDKENALKMKIHVRGTNNDPKEKRIQMLRNNVANGNASIDNIKFINWDNLDVEDYIDLTQSTNSEIDASTTSMKTEKTDDMTERSMKTITKNPKNTNSDDQRMEYADYYNVVDELDEGRKLKNEERQNPRARSIRQSFTVSSTNRNSDDYLYIPNQVMENNLDFKYANENANNLENHLSNSISLASVQTNNENDDSINLQIGKEQSVSPDGLEPKKLYDSTILSMDQDKNVRPAKTNENSIASVSNFALSKLGQSERSRPVLVGQENSVNTDVNPAILQSNEQQYNLPVENNDMNLNNNYVFNSGQEGRIRHPVEDNFNYLNNYGTLSQKQDERYNYPIVYNLSEDQLSDKVQLPEVNKKVKNTVELKNPSNIYSNQYEKTFMLPRDQPLVHYPPAYKNTYQGDRLLHVNTFNAPNDESRMNLRGNINTKTNEPLRKISDTSISRDYVQPVERFPSIHNFESEETWTKENNANDPMNQQIIRRGLQKEFENSENSKRKDETAAEEEERLRRDFAKRRKNAIVRKQHSVEDDVANLQHVDIAATVNETKEVADQILNRIVDELEEIKMDHSKDKTSEGFPCKLTGSWVTSKAGVRIDIKVMNHSVTVTLANLIPQPMHVGLINTTWNITGHAPFKRGGPFSLLAYDNHTKTLAVFVGSCRVCQGIDTIEGIWSVAREPRDCRNFQMATEIFNDIFRRTKLLSAVKEKKKAILQSMLMRNIQNTTSHRGVTGVENDPND